MTHTRDEFNIGVTGHQKRDGLDWSWTRASISSVLHDEMPVTGALTSLAVGTDQIFAEEALACAIRLKVIIPFADYDRCFTEQDLANYRRLLARAYKSVVIDPMTSDQQAFLAAGMQIANESDLIVAVWDGKPAVGLGGTADIVKHALAAGRQVIHLDPFSRTIQRLSVK